VFDGKIYRGTAFRVTGGAREALDRYRAGDRIPVHLDPARPERALIQPGLVASDFWQLGLAGGLLLAALWLVRRQVSP
jgi:acyl dehydratase